ncbi:MAG: energy-coupling factor transporter transmembrane protein EcfT [Verrucomicrobiales bacterium]|jgi:cobalt/nickel transport system permease protein|nr:energy-coupling factor transporter transmembrane protein EcfT [Verrucomicrobiales bacterium]
MLALWSLGEDCAARKRHPTAPLLVTVCFVTVAASFDKYEFSAPLPLGFYPLFMFIEKRISPKKILWWLLPTLPLVAGVGLFNPLFDREPALTLAGLTINGGWLSFASIFLRGTLCVTASLLMMSTIGAVGISQALAALKVPPLLVTQLTLTLRYLQTFMEEAGRILLAYRLRAPGKKSVALRECGSLLGQWLLRALRHAERLHQAMRCRGFRGTLTVTPRWLTVSDGVYIAGWCGFFFTARLVNIPLSLGNLILFPIQ